MAEIRQAKRALAARLVDAEQAMLAAPPRRPPTRVRTIEDAVASAVYARFEDAAFSVVDTGFDGGPDVRLPPLERAPRGRLPLRPAGVVVGLGIGLAPGATLVRNGRASRGGFVLAVRTLHGDSTWSSSTALEQALADAADVPIELRVVRRARPQCGPGDSIGSARSATTGTLGGVLPDQRRGCTANHVAALVNQGIVGDVIESVTGDFRRRAGILDWYEPLVAGEPNVVDLATLTLDAAPDGLRPLRRAVEVEPGDEVTMLGARSGTTTGVVTSVEHDEAISYGGIRHPFTGLVEVTGHGGPLSRPGDSGALVTAGDGIAGMLVAGVVADRRSLLTGSGALFATLGVEEVHA